MSNDMKTVVQAVQEAYDALSPFSDASRWEFWNHVAHVGTIAELVGTSDRVVDVGCYIGIQALALRILGYDMCGNDLYIFRSKEQGNAYGFSEEEVAQLRDVWDKHGLRIGSCDAATEEPAQQYDLVINVAVLEHQPYPKEFVEGLMKFCKAGGKIYISTPNAAKLSNRLRFLLGRPVMSNIDEFYRNARTFNGHWREYVVAEVARMGRMSGLGVVWAKGEQVEPPGPLLSRKWARNILRLLSRMRPKWGDSVVVLFEKPLSSPQEG